MHSCRGKFLTNALCITHLTIRCLVPCVAEVGFSVPDIQITNISVNELLAVKLSQTFTKRFLTKMIAVTGNERLKIFLSSFLVRSTQLINEHEHNKDMTHEDSHFFLLFYKLCH